MKVRFVLVALCAMLLAVTALTIDDDQSNTVDDFDDELLDTSSDGLADLMLDRRAGGARGYWATRRRQDFEEDDDMLDDEPIFDELEDAASDPKFGRFSARGYGGFRRGYGGFGRRWGGFGRRWGGFGRRWGGFGRRRGGFGRRWGGFRGGYRGGFGRGRFYDMEENHDISEDIPEEFGSDDVDDVTFDPQLWRRPGGWGSRGGGRGYGYGG